MFDGIAGHYDLLNHLLSASIDRWWRRKLAKQALRYHPQQVLDAATGTADLAIALARQGIPQITGIDISQKMIDEGHKKLSASDPVRNICLQRADGEHLPFADGSFDMVTMAFGIRNYEDRHSGFAEIARVLRPQGRFLMLEFAMPRRTIVKWLYSVYFFKILPCIGKIISRHNTAYQYLPQSVYDFPLPCVLSAEMATAGLECTAAQPLTLGIVYMYNAKKQ
jgi:demethylmenaquinone methyltransferase/2-methoxy-6-polyprenyl-1,4-benzoquinol methylase